MKKIVIAFTAVFCINSVILAQDVQELKYFKSDNAFYLGSNRLLDNEVERTLSSNISALEMWQKGNHLKQINTTTKILTCVLLPAGGMITIVSFCIGVTLWFVPNNADVWLLSGASLLTVGGLTGIMIPITKANYKSCYSDATNIYNNSKNAVSLHIGMTGNGLGFSLKF